MKSTTLIWLTILMAPCLPSGDFTFALSLASHHGCRLMLATCYDTEEVLYSKYHEARSTLDKLRSCGQGSADVDEDGQGIRNSNNLSKSYPVSPRVLFGVDCRKLGSPAGGGQAVRAGFRGINRERDRGIPAKPVGGPWDVIVFNFPHVGGLSTDVNRQVRANQELLVTFFKACVPLLSYPNSPDSDEYYDDSDSDDLPFISDDERNFSRSKKEPGKIIVTLFEQEPYTLWNIRDLARHVGLRVVTSFRFPWTSYPGYSHARTIGDIKSQGSERRGWRGEERAARSYIFECKGFDKLSDTRQKRKRHSQESDED